MAHSNRTVKTVFIMIGLSLGSKLFGLVREMLIAAKFGSGAETDAFFIALTATSLLTIMLTQAINTTIIPFLTEVEKDEGKQGKELNSVNLLNIVIIVSSIMVVLGWILTPFIIKLIAYGFNEKQFDQAVFLMRIGLPAIIFAGIVGVFRGYLQSESRFIESAASQFPYNFVFIFFLIFMADTFGVLGLMIASVFAVGSQILIQIPGIKRSGFKYRFVLNVKNKYIKKVSYLIPPVLLSVAINDINKLVDKSLASTLIDGSISALNYGNYLKDLVLGVFVTTIITVMFPILSKEATKDKLVGLKKVVGEGINYILLITIPATIGMLVLAKPIVRIAFERGAFDSTATNMTTGALIFYSIGFTGMGLRIFLDRVYYALQDTKTPMINGFIAVALNISLNLILIKYMDHRGLALATSISATLTTILLLVGLKKKIGPLDLKRNIVCIKKTISASVIMGVVVYFTYDLLNNLVSSNIWMEITILLVTGLVGLFLYLFLIYIFKVEEFKFLSEVVQRKFVKR